MDENTITRYILITFDGVRATETWGDTFFFYNPDPDRPGEIYFTTLKSADDDYDNASNLSRPGFYRLNIGVGKETYFTLFESRPERPDSEGKFDDTYDFTATDVFMPHPIYGRQYWISVINPGEETFELVRAFLAEAYAIAVAKYEKSV